MSVLIVEEIHVGLAAKPNERLLREINSLLEAASVTVLPINAAIAARAGVLLGRFRREGISHTAVDMLIAATALLHDLRLITRNTRDFESTGIDVQNPFRRRFIVIPNR